MVPHKAVRGRPVRDVGDVEKRRKLQAPMKAVDPKLRHTAAWNRMRAASSACSAAHRPELEFRGTWRTWGTWGTWRTCTLDAGREVNGRGGRHEWTPGTWGMWRTWTRDVEDVEDVRTRRSAGNTAFFFSKDLNLHLPLLVGASSIHMYLEPIWPSNINRSMNGWFWWFWSPSLP